MARRYPPMMDVGWILARTSSLARFSSSAATITTLVVPSPTCRQQAPARAAEAACRAHARLFLLGNPQPTAPAQTLSDEPAAVG